MKFAKERSQKEAMWELGEYHTVVLRASSLNDYIGKWFMNMPGSIQTNIYLMVKKCLWLMFMIIILSTLNTLRPEKLINISKLLT